MAEEKKKRPKAVVGVLIFKTGKVLIGKRRGTATHGSGEYSFPGGHIEDRESFEQSVLREISEEAGSEIKIKNLKFQCIANIDKYKDHQVVLVGMTADWENGEPKSTPEENIGEWEWCDLNNLPSPLFYPTEILIDSYKTGKNYYDKE
jgi:8-oxo-dGTP diphosphatase